MRLSVRGNTGRGDAVRARSEAAARERARLLIELGRPREAIEQCRRARAGGDQSAELDELEGLALIRADDNQAALEVLGRGIAREPSRSHLHYLWSFAARAVGRAGEGESALTEALRLAPEEPVYLRAQAELLSDKKEHARAIEVARDAVRHGADRAANFVTLGYVASAAGDKALARSSYEKALELDPQESAAWNNLGCLDLEEGKALAARERFRESLRLAPEGPRARKNLEQTLAGRTLEGFARWDDVVRAIAEELSALEAVRLLAALALEADAAGAALSAALGRPGGLRWHAALGAFATGALAGAMRGLGLPGALGAGVLLSVGARRLLVEERRRVRKVLGDTRAAFEAVRADWLAGRIERAARDGAARRLVEQATLDLCEPRSP